MLRGVDHASHTHKGLAQKINKHALFQVASAIVIVVNVLWMGWAADVEMTRVYTLEEESSMARIVDVTFAILYSLELTIRVVAERCEFVMGADRSWNLFDSVLVLHSIYELISVAITPTSSNDNVSFLRTMRLMKTAKMLRVIRLMRSMRELRLLLHAILGSLRSMLWSIVLIALVLYTFATIFVQSCASAALSEGLDASTMSGIRAFWSSIGHGMISLFMSATGGESWARIAQPLRDTSSFFYLVFILYLLVFHFVLLNIITSVFIEACLDNANKDTLGIIQAEMEQKEHYMAVLEVLFEEMDANKDGIISLDEFTDRMDDPQMQAFVSSLGIQIDDAGYVFRLLSSHGTNKVDLVIFVEGCIKMKGNALSIDLQDLLIRKRFLLSY